MALQLGQNRMNPPDLFLKSPPSSTSLGGSCWPDPAVCQCPLCCVDECPAATERRGCCGGSPLNRGLKTVSNFVTWCGGGGGGGAVNQEALWCCWVLERTTAPPPPSAAQPAPGCSTSQRSIVWTRNYQYKEHLHAVFICPCVFCQSLAYI